MNVYIVKWNKEDAPWQRILADILKRDYKIENCPKILRDAMGKPYFEGYPLHFNVSHSGEYLAIAISKNPVGIDIQGEKNIKDGMFKKVVQQEEISLIGENRQKDFLKLWTLKESFVKAEGKGLRIALKDYYFQKENGQYFVTYCGQRMPWTFNIEETLIPNYVISACAMDEEFSWIVKQE